MLWKKSPQPGFEPDTSRLSGADVLQLVTIADI